MMDELSCWWNVIRNSDAKTVARQIIGLELHLFVTPSFWSLLKENMKQIHVDVFLESFVLESIAAC